MNHDNFMYARYEMAFTLGSHIIIACFGVGFPVLLMTAEGMYLRTKDPVWKDMAKRWAKVFAVLFAVGAVSGTVLSFELGLLFPEFMGRFGVVIGFPFTMEGFAFFLEAIFVGIYLYGWNKLSPFVHWMTSWPIVISGAASAWFVVTVNSWMNVPQGFRMEGNKVVEVEPFTAMLNPATGSQTTHMIIAAYMVTGFMVASYYAWVHLRGKAKLYDYRAMVLGLLLAGVMSPLQFLAGDWAAKVVAETQPVKLASMEGQYETEKGAGIRIGGIPDDKDEVTRYAIEIPYLLSLMSYGDANAEVKGLKAFPKEDRPPTLVVHMAFQIMVGIGTYLLALSCWAGWRYWKKQSLTDNRWFLWAVVFSGPLCVLAMEAGWVVTEVGRQPWVVYGIMRTRDAVTQADGIVWLFMATMLLYAGLAIGTFVVLRILANVPHEETQHGT
jgi:cytochrome d ubiquinol oxidase subunit I